MTKRNHLLAIVIGLALAGMPLMGCGGTDDPSRDRNNTSENNDPGNNDPGNNDPGNNDPGNNDPGNNDPGNNDPGNNDPGNNDPGNNDPGNNDPGNNDPGNNDPGNNDPGACTTNTNFFGQVGNVGEHDGGTWTTDAPDYDAGLGVLGDLFDGIAVNETLELDEPISISGATVIATSYVTQTNNRANREFWVEDENTAALIFLQNALETTVKVGQKVSFDITALQNFNGTAQIAGVTDFTVESENNPVSYVDLTGEDIDMTFYNSNVRVGGVVIADKGGCGGNYTCYDLEHGPAGAKKVIELRSNSNFVEVGDCVTYFGPLGSFPGPLNDRGEEPQPQLNSIPYGWLYDPPVFD